MNCGDPQFKGISVTFDGLVGKTQTSQPYLEDKCQIRLLLSVCCIWILFAHFVKMTENDEYSLNKSVEEKNQSHSGSKTDAVDKSPGFFTFNLQVFGL